MSRKRNALRQHFIAPLSQTSPTETAYLRLSRYISDISANNDETVDTEAFYHGDGTPENTVTAIQKGYSVEGYRYAGDPAQDLIAEMELGILDDRKVWHKVVSADGSKTYEGVATVSNIVIDGGSADEFETFSCDITYDQIPTITNGSGGSGISTFSGVIETQEAPVKSAKQK